MAWLNKNVKKRSKAVKEKGPRNDGFWRLSRIGTWGRIKIESRGEAGPVKA
jgi:hypothetical protein